MVNALPPSYLLPHTTRELFEHLDAYTDRLRGFVLSESLSLLFSKAVSRLSPNLKLQESVLNSSSTLKLQCTPSIWQMRQFSYPSHLS